MTAQSTSDTSSATDPDRTEDDDGSFAAFFGWDNQDPDAARARLREEETRVQESIRQCMAEQGFEYRPVLPPDDAFAVASDLDDEEWVRTEGFGITTWYGREEGTFRHETRTDPNQEILDAMSESERQAWNDALYGTQEELEAEMEVEVLEETGDTVVYGTGYGPGCQGQAYEKEFGDRAAAEELWREVQPAIEEMHERIEAEPRVVEAWSACMSQAGYDVATREELYDHAYELFQARLDDIVGDYGHPFRDWPEEEVDAFYAENTEAEIAAFLREAEEESLENIDVAALRALQQEEIDMAVASYECGHELEAVYSEVRAEYEADLIATNRETFEQLRAAAES